MAVYAKKHKNEPGHLVSRRVRQHFAILFFRHTVTPVEYAPAVLIVVVQKEPAWAAPVLAALRKLL